MTKGLNRALRRVTQYQDLLVTPGVERFLREQGDIVLTLDLAQQLMRMTMAQPRNRAASWSASARGRCLREQTFTYIGVPQRGSLDVVLQNLFNDGTWRHLRWQMMLMLAGVLTAVEVPLYNDEYNVTGSADGLNHDLEFGFELKGASRPPDVPDPHHVLQIHTYMLLLGFDTFALVYESKYSQDWREFRITLDPKVMAETTNELNYLNQCVADKVLPPVQPECIHGKGDAFTQCGFRDVCLGTHGWGAAESLATRVAAPAPAGGGTAGHPDPPGGSPGHDGRAAGPGVTTSADGSGDPDGSGLGVPRSGPGD